MVYSPPSPFVYIHPKIFSCNNSKEVIAATRSILKLRKYIQKGNGKEDYQQLAWKCSTGNRNVKT